jgi:hypothetical protein
MKGSGHSMADPGYLLGVYLHLAQASQRRRRPHVRDRLLLLAAERAATMGLDTIAAYCRQLVLEHNPHHLIRRWADEQYQCLARQLRRRYPQERAERMLQSLDIELARERQAYYSDYEYAAALLGTTTEELDRHFS